MSKKNSSLLFSGLLPTCSVYQPIRMSTVISVVILKQYLWLVIVSWLVRVFDCVWPFKWIEAYAHSCETNTWIHITCLCTAMRRIISLELLFACFRNFLNTRSLVSHELSSAEHVSRKENLYSNAFCANSETTVKVYEDMSCIRDCLKIEKIRSEMNGKAIEGSSAINSTLIWINRCISF